MYAVIDIEATGGNAKQGKVTEIAIYKYDGKTIVDEFHSLVNPECSIPPYVQRLTGINNKMAKEAPKFHEIAKSVVEITKNANFVAHNAKFDYSFLKAEFADLGYDFIRDRLCTLQLSRILLPDLPSYSLGKLCNSLGIPLKNRHRADGDALATVALLEKLLATDAIAVKKMIRKSFAKEKY